ncbi:crotonobetainyl-CoA--carnitine CoA-transferase [Pseudoalteromonas sp. SS15]|uniref:crotonobetainyl-CoA--carnitine CoA-transferase n=1 Tax=Pseudoalteromonas sp. SS15 TaxID=3139393 RepID=UPI003BAB186D
MTLSKTLLMTTSLFISAFALASDVQFSSVDANKDGVISQTEAKAVPKVAAQFYQLDKNKNGELSEAEFKNFKQ